MECFGQSVVFTLVGDVWAISSVDDFEVEIFGKHLEVALLVLFALFAYECYDSSSVIAMGSVSLGSEVYFLSWRM